MAAPFRTSVIEPWIDYNGHLNEGYYGVIFSNASDDLLEQLGFGEQYRNAERGTFYTVEAHIRFLADVSLGETLRIDMRVLGLDTKRLHFWHEMYRDSDDAPLATHESMLLHVDIDDVRVRPMSAELYANALAEYVASNADRPEAAGAAVHQLPPPAPGVST